MEAPGSSVEVQEFRACREESVFHFLVDSNIRTAEAVDRLLGITNQEQLSWNGTDIAQIGLTGIVGGEQDEDFGLD
jgi:hypothetical protein